MIRHKNNIDMYLISFCNFELQKKSIYVSDFLFQVYDKVVKMGH